MFAAPRRLSNIPKNDTVSQQNILYLSETPINQNVCFGVFLIPKIKEGDIMSALKKTVLSTSASAPRIRQNSPDAQQRLLPGLTRRRTGLSSQKSSSSRNPSPAGMRTGGRSFRRWSRLPNRSPTRSTWSWSGNTAGLPVIRKNPSSTNHCWKRAM